MAGIYQEDLIWIEDVVGGRWEYFRQIKPPVPIYEMEKPPHYPVRYSHYLPDIPPICYLARDNQWPDEPLLPHLRIEQCYKAIERLWHNEYTDHSHIIPCNVGWYEDHIYYFWFVGGYKPTDKDSKRLIAEYKKKKPEQQYAG